MARPKPVYLCQQCAHEAAKWLGQCPACGAWNTLVETARVDSPSPRSSSGSASRSGGGAFGETWATLAGDQDAGSSRRASVPVSLADVNPDEAPRRTGGISEFDRVLGGGIVPGALMLIGGDPGIGKSTLLLQVAARVASGGSRVLYVSGEESARQVRLRASRLGALEPSLFVLAETNVEAASAAIARLDPAMVVVDSIQTMWSDALASSPGNVAQLRESTLRLMQVAKARDVPIFLIGHVTKEGNVAGPRALEHMVDAVLYLEGERYYSYRLLRAAKNRFGSTNEVGVFEMTTDGLAEVTNPSAAFLAGRVARQPGSIVTAPVEGTRALLVDVQALTVPGGIGIARRTAIGADLNRLQLLVAVLTRRLGLGLGAQDIYVNVAGGLKIVEPAVDLALAFALVSSFQEIAIDDGTVVVGEVGLQGELRPVGQVERRLAEAARLGFTRCILPAGDVDRITGVRAKRSTSRSGSATSKGSERPAIIVWEGMTLVGVPTVGEAVLEAFGAGALRRSRASSRRDDASAGAREDVPERGGRTRQVSDALLQEDSQFEDDDA